MRAVLELLADADPPDFAVRFEDIDAFWRANEPYQSFYDEMMDRAHRKTGATSVVIVHPRFGAILGKVYD